MAVFLGKNGSGKTTFFDVFGFLHDCLSGNVKSALAWRGGYREVISRGHDGEDISFIIKFRPSADEPLIAEEPENRLYPELLEELAEEFQSYSSGGQVLISTHSPDFLNAVPLDAIYCLTKKEGYTVITRAIDNSIAKALFEAGDLPGALWRKGILTEGLP